MHGCICNNEQSIVLSRPTRCQAGSGQKVAGTESGRGTLQPATKTPSFPGDVVNYLN